MKFDHPKLIEVLLPDDTLFTSTSLMMSDLRARAGGSASWVRSQAWVPLIQVSVMLGIQDPGCCCVQAFR